MRDFTCARVAAGCWISSVVARSILLRYVIFGDSDAHLSILATAVGSGVFENSFLSLTTLKSFRLAKAIHHSTTHHAPLITVTSYD